MLHHLESIPYSEILIPISKHIGWDFVLFSMLGSCINCSELSVLVSGPDRLRMAQNYDQWNSQACDMAVDLIYWEIESWNFQTNQIHEVTGKSTAPSILASPSSPVALTVGCLSESRVCWDTKWNGLLSESIGWSTVTCQQQHRRHTEVCG